MDFADLSKRLGITIDPALLELALTHRSFSYENGKQPDNERLEFLGDSVLGFLVTEHIFEANPDLDEGELSRLRNATVSAKTLSIAAEKLGLGEFIKLGKGEAATGGSSKPNILADTFEAVLGAAFLSNGLPAAKHLVENLVLPLIDSKDVLLETSEPRTVLLELLKKQGKGEPEFRIEHEGPDHDRTFHAQVFVSGDLLASGSGRTRKQAEAAAAVAALSILRG